MGPSSRTLIFDTGELSQISLVYNDITLQINPDIKISNERSSETDVWQILGSINTAFLDTTIFYLSHKIKS
jgi:hypothetical protein